MTIISSMKKNRIITLIVLLAIGIPGFFVYSTFTNSKGCGQLVIDTYEFHSGIDIPNVQSVNCYYDEKSQTRISVYNLLASMDLSRFETSANSTNIEYLNGMGLLDETERPKSKKIYRATGEKKGTKWTYIVDKKANRLWAELKYAD